MREMLFKGKTYEGEWVQGDLNHYHSGSGVFISERESKGDFCKRVIPETVGQYTGLTDKNGKKIFEGDIHERENHFFIVKYGKYKDCETDEDGYGWYFEYTHRKGCERFCGDEERYVNIIGNIHDNPELLGGEDDV